MVINYTNPKQLIGKEMYGYNPMAGEKAGGEAFLKALFGEVDRRRALQDQYNMLQMKQRITNQSQTVIDPNTGKQIIVPAETGGLLTKLYEQYYNALRDTNKAAGQQSFAKYKFEKTNELQERKYEWIDKINKSKLADNEKTRLLGIMEKNADNFNYLLNNTTDESLEPIYRKKLQEIMYGLDTMIKNSLQGKEPIPKLTQTKQTQSLQQNQNTQTQQPVAFTIMQDAKGNKAKVYSDGRIEEIK